MIEHPAVRYSPEAWKVLEMLYEYDHAGARPDGQIQGGERRDLLKAQTRVSEEEYGLLIYFGLTVERACDGETQIPDEAWMATITPKGRQVIDFGHMHNFLSSIATALPGSDQAGWMVATAKDGLRLTDDGEAS